MRLAKTNVPEIRYQEMSGKDGLQLQKMSIIRANDCLLNRSGKERVLQQSEVRRVAMEKSTVLISNVWPPEETESDENDITHPLRIISSYKSQPGIPRKPRGSWFKKRVRPGADRTPDFIEIGDPTA